MGMGPKYGPKLAMKKGLVPYCGTDIVGPDKTLHILRGVLSGHTLFVAHEQLKKIFLSLHVQYLSKILSQ